jgi:hypothetical protein
LLGTHKATLSRHVARVKLRAVLRAFWRALARAEPASRGRREG